MPVLPLASSGLPEIKSEQLIRSLSDLAPDEVYIAGTLTHPAGGLLHHRFTLTAKRRFTFCCTVSQVALGGR